MDNAEEIRTYLEDLADIRTEHEKAADTCPDCINGRKGGYSGGCTLISVISVEIMTYQRKLDQIA